MRMQTKTRFAAAFVGMLALVNATGGSAEETQAHCAPGVHNLCLMNGGGPYCPGNPYGACIEAYQQYWGCNVLITNYGSCVPGSGECSWNISCTLSEP